MGNALRLSWISIIIVVVAIIGISLVILNLSVPAGLEFLDPYELTENLISATVVLLIGAILFKIKLQLYEETAWKLFFVASIFMIIGNILDIPTFPEYQWISYLVFIFFALSLFSVIFAVIYAIKHSKNIIVKNANITKLTSIILAIIALSIPIVIGLSNFYQIDSIKMIFLMFDIIIFVLSMTLLSWSFRVNLFYTYSFIAFGVFFMVLANAITIVLSIVGTTPERFISILWIISIALLAISADVRLNSGEISHE